MWVVVQGAGGRVVHREDLGFTQDLVHRILVMVTGRWGEGCTQAGSGLLWQGAGVGEEWVIVECIIESLNLARYMDIGFHL